MLTSFLHNITPIREVFRTAVFCTKVLYPLKKLWKDFIIPIIWYSPFVSFIFAISLSPFLASLQAFTEDTPEDGAVAPLFSTTCVSNTDVTGGTALSHLKKNSRLLILPAKVRLSDFTLSSNRVTVVLILNTWSTKDAKEIFNFSSFVLTLAVFYLIPVNSYSFRLNSIPPAHKRSHPRIPL